MWLDVCLCDDPGGGWGSAFPAPPPPHDAIASAPNTAVSRAHIVLQRKLFAIIVLSIGGVGQPLA
jgi:hypothetical protein